MRPHEYVPEAVNATYVDGSGGMPDWGDLGVDVVVDCSGRATRREGARRSAKTCDVVIIELGS